MPVEFLKESEQFADNRGDVYPDNMQTVLVFSDTLTQWRSGPSGATGIDYSVLPVVFDIRGVKEAERAAIFDGLQVMERSALKEIRRKR